ncbi:MAG: hypothetical protein IPK60_24035 [Sandaracinaceae bacterium]|nr:hypothetical protein [Sandaracinaceae bacterium]
MDRATAHDASLFNDAYARALGADGVGFVAMLREHSADLAAHCTDSTVSLEAYATLAEWTGNSAAAAKRIADALPTLRPELLGRAHSTLGRLLILSGSRERAGIALAEAEALSESSAESLRIARDRALLAMTDRQWSNGENELLRVEAACTAASASIFALEAAIYRATSLVGNGAAAEALDLLLSRYEEVPKGGLLELRALLVLARAHIDRIELDRASELVERARTLCDPELFEAYVRLVHADADLAAWRSEWPASRRHLQTLHEVSVARQLPIYEAHACYARALLEFDADDFECALEYAAKTIGLGLAIEHVSIVNAARLIQACALAKLARRNDALKSYRAARKPSIEGIDSVYFDGLAALAEILLANLASSPDEAAAFELLAKNRIATIVVRNPQGIRHVESSFHLHVLSRRLRRYAEERKLETSLVSRTRLAAVDVDGRWIELSTGERISVEQRPVLQRLLSCLWRNAKARPNEPIMAAELIAATWPNDRASETSLRVRLRVAVATLRQFGLEDALHTQKSGYFLSL